MKIKVSSFVKSVLRKVKFLTKKKNMNKLLILVGVLLLLLLIRKYYLSKEGFEVENLEQEVNDGELPKLIFFGADWCGHCQNFYPTWDKMSSNNEHKKKVKFLKVNCTDNDDENVQDAMKKYNVKGFPTLIVYRNNKSEEYSGPREEDSIMKLFS